MKKSTFDSAMVDALDVTYTLQGISATYTPSGGSAKTVTVLVDGRTSNAQEKAGGRMKVDRLIGSLRTSEVSALGRGDTIVLGGETTVFKVLPSSVSNDGIEWDFEAVSETPIQLGDVARMPDR